MHQFKLPCSQNLSSVWEICKGFVIWCLVYLIGPWVEASHNSRWIWMYCCFISWEISCEQQPTNRVSPGISFSPCYWFYREGRKISVLLKSNFFCISHHPLAISLSHVLCTLVVLKHLFLINFHPWNMSFSNITCLVTFLYMEKLLF